MFRLNILLFDCSLTIQNSYMNPTLYEKIGGKEIVEKASHFLYVNMLRDDLLRPFFENVDIDKQERKMTAFLTYIFGGNSLYTGKNMRQAHKHAVEAGLADKHVDAMIECVCQTLMELNIDNNYIGEVVQSIEKHRDDVLNR